jgi:hypothetical protein
MCNKEGLCPSIGDIKRLMMMMMKLEEGHENKRSVVEMTSDSQGRRQAGGWS